MPWLRVDDRMYCNRKVVKASLGGKALWIWGMEFSADQLTDGILEPAEVQMLAGMLQLPDWQSVAEELVAIGLFERDDQGRYIVHDYLKYNPSREEVLAQRDSNAQRQADWQAKKRTAQSAASTVSNAVSNGVSKSAPVPVPVPVPNKNNGAIAPVTSKAPLKDEKTKDVVEKIARGYVEGMGWDPDQITDTDRKKWGPALLDLRKLGASAEEVRDCTEHMRKTHKYWKTEIPPPSAVVTYYKEWVRMGKPKWKGTNGTVNKFSPSALEQMKANAEEAERLHDERQREASTV